MIRILPILLVLPLVAGCVGGDDEPLVPGAGDTSLGDAVGTGTEAELPEETEAPEPIETPVQYDGETGNMACVGTESQLQCWARDGRDAIRDLEFPGDAQRLVAEVTWSPDTPATNELRVMIMAGDDGMWVWNDTMPTTTGSSPLSLDWDLRNLAGHDLVLHVSAMRGTGAGGTRLLAETSQGFAVNGTMVSLLPQAT